MRGIFLNIEKLFESRGQDFDLFVKEMNSKSLHNIIMLKVFTEFEQKLADGKIYSDFSTFKDEVFNAGRSAQNDFHTLLDKFMPMIMDSFKPKAAERVSMWQKMTKFFGGTN